MRTILNNGLEGTIMIIRTHSQLFSKLMKMDRDQKPFRPNAAKALEKAIKHNPVNDRTLRADQNPDRAPRRDT